MYASDITLGREEGVGATSPTPDHRSAATINRNQQNYWSITYPKKAPRRNATIPQAVSASVTIVPSRAAFRPKSEHPQPYQGSPALGCFKLLACGKVNVGAPETRAWPKSSMA